MTFLVLDLETIADLSRWSPPDDKPDAFPPTWACRVVCAGYVHLSVDYKLLSLGAIVEHHTDVNPDVREQSLLSEFAGRIDQVKPTIVTFNGRGFDMPVLVARSLLHGVSLPWYYRTRDARYRYSEQGHLDLCDALTDHGAAKMATLDAWARLIGLPGKVNGDGTQVAELYATDQLEAIANYCLADVAQTALLLVRYRLLQGHFDRNTWAMRAGDLLAAFRNDPRLRSVFCSSTERETQQLRLEVA